MSHEATNWAIKQRGLTPPAKIVLWHLCDRYHPDNGCFPSQDRLVEDCEISRSSLNTQLKALEDAGLIRREQRRDDRTRKQKSTFYRFAFEPDFQPVEQGEPCPDVGHGNDPEPVSKSGAEPCPNPGDSRVQNLDTNPVRVTSKRTSNEREGGREGAEGEKSETVSVETWKRRFRKAHADWPTYADDSPEPTEKAWFALSEADREKAVELQGAYVHHVKTVLKRQAICRYSIYLKEKRWEKLPEKVVKASADKSSQDAKPFGKGWGVVRLADLVQAPYGMPQKLTSTEERLCAAGHYDRETLLREKRAKFGWPNVILWQERALRHHKGVAVPADLSPLMALFGQVSVGSDLWRAWADLHRERGWPWIEGDLGRVEWVYFPEPPGSIDSYPNLLEAVRAAMARFETEHATITQKDAVE